ncbi:hypothetical protein [Zavarzinella formosa]|uniref:hypothetical protein n=1 Tax=Zavarzinella formosa TaxID=360055 RepID=UPI0002F13720|nr:hypothetical protein [Zavarzinella formosa]
MPERNGPGLLIIGRLREPPGAIHVEAGNDADIEYTKRQARSLVQGPEPMCMQAWVVQSLFEVSQAPTPGHPE